MRPLALLFLISCLGKPGNSDSVEQICNQVVECNTYGWSDQSECENGWIDNPDFGTECAYESQYLSCAEECVVYDCDDFEDCESFCWVSYCL